MAPSFATDIAPMLAPFQINMAWRFDLGDYDAVRTSAQAIWERISSSDAAMPPPPLPPLTKKQIAVFAQWIEADCPR